MSPAAVIGPPALIEHRAQGLAAPVIFDARMESPGAGLIPVGAAHHMSGQPEGFGLMGAPEGKLPFLLEDVVLPEKVPEGILLLHPEGNALSIVARNGRADALETDDHLADPSLRLCGPDHGQGMAVFRPPDMDDLGAERLQLMRKFILQLRGILVRRHEAEAVVAAVLIYRPVLRPGTRAEDVHLRAFLPQLLQHPVHPQAGAGTSAALLLHHPGGQIAKP